MTTRTRNIFLVGPMGAGKTAVGRRLARDIGAEFRDSDAVIEARTGVDIPYIFEKEGEEGFRRREADIVEELTGADDIVLATGGGAVTVEENRNRLAGRGTVVYLHATVAQQLERTSHNKNRPLLMSGDSERILADLMERRDPLYRDIASIIVETDGRSVADVAAEIRARLDDDEAATP